MDELRKEFLTLHLVFSHFNLKFLEVKKNITKNSINELNFREKYKHNVKEFDKVAGGILRFSNSSNLFNDIFNTNNNV